MSAWTSDDIWNAAAEHLDSLHLPETEFTSDLPGLHLAMYAYGNGILAAREESWDMADDALRTCDSCGCDREPLDLASRLYAMCDNGCDEEELAYDY